MDDLQFGAAGAAGEAVSDGTAPAWTDALSADQRALVETKGWRDPADVVTSYQHAERHIGRDPNGLVPVPGPAASAEAWDAVYDRLGRPEDPDGYAFEAIDGVDTGDDAALAGLAHELGLNPDQATHLRQRHYEATTRATQEQLGVLRSGIRDVGQTLRAAWGSDFQERDGLAGQAAEFIGLDAAALGRSGVLNGESGVRLMHGLARLGEMLAEDKVMGGGAFVPVASQALSEMEQLKLDPGFLDAYLNRDHVGHRAAVDRMRRLSEAAWPEPRR